MEKLVIEKQKYTPYIELDPEGKIVIDGKSYPENSITFFNPVLEWVEEYISKNCKKLELYIHLAYFNSSTSQVLFELFDLLSEYNKKCPDMVSIYWQYDEDNDSAMEAGEDFQEDFEDLNIELVELKD